MKTTAFLICLALTLTVGTAFSQSARVTLPAKQDATVVLANPISSQSVEQLTRLLKSEAHVEVAFDADHSTFTLRGDASNLGLSEWLLHQIDKPEGWQPTGQEAANPSLRAYLSAPNGLPPDDKVPVTHIYYLKSSTGLAEQEILTIARVVGGFPLVSVIDKPRIMVFRGNQVSVDLLEWMIQKLDVPADGASAALQNQNPQSGVYALPSTADGSEDLVRVFYLSPSTTPKDLSSITTSIRDAAKTKNVFPKTSPPAIAIRGTPALIAQAQQIINSAQ
jgi:hypothetical protein